MCRTRSEASALAQDGHVRINAQRCLKPGYRVTPGDVLTLVVGGRICVVRVASLGTRRGPAPEACALYVIVDPDGIGSTRLE